MVKAGTIEYLSRVAKEVLEAKDGKDANKVCREKKPDILISDISIMASIWQIRSHDKDV